MPATSPTSARAAVFALLAGLGLVACDDGEGATPPTTTAVVAGVPTTTAPPRADDGRLTVGLLLPSTGDGSAMGQFLSDAARRAVNEVNVAGGVRGEPVEVVPADEGETAAEAAEAAQTLIDAGVDAVVGPASSVAALSALDVLLGAGVVTCSPTASTLALDDYPGRDLFFRTAPSDSLQALGLAQLAEQTGKSTVAVTWLDDVYGRPLAAAVTDALRLRPAMEVVASVPFGDRSVEEAAAEIAQADPGVVVVVADADDGTQLLAALSTVVLADPAVDQPDIIVNDAMRIPPSPQAIATLPPGFRASIQGLSPVATGTEDLTGPFATNAYDCAVLIALAAEQAGTDDHAAMARAVSELSTRGGVCRTFDACRAALVQGRNVDYDGPASPGVQIAADGDPDRARYDQFVYDDAGIDRTTRTITVSR